MTTRARLHLLVLVVLLAAPAALVVVAAPATACSCAKSAPREQARAADAVFVATVREDVDDGGNGGTGTVVFEADVESVFSGDVETTARLATAAQGSACGLAVRGGGERWLFLATGGPAVYDVGLCGGSTLADPRVVREASAALGAPRAPTVSEHTGSGGGVRTDDDPPAQTAYPWWAVGVGAGVVVAVLASLAWALHPGRRAGALRPAARPRR